MIRAALLLAVAAPVTAQSDPAVDSAAVARTAWREAAAAEGRGDRAQAFAEVNRAAHAWPEQPFYQEALAMLAARRGDQVTLLGALARLTTMETGGRVLRDTAVVRMGAAPDVAGALARLAAASAPKPASGVWARLADSTIYPEGIDADPGGDAVFVASVRHRTVYRVAADGSASDLGLARHDRVGAIMGVRFDRTRGLLWVTTVGLPVMEGYRPGDSAIAALIAIRPSDGEVVQRVDLPAGGPTVPGDLAIGPAGDVFVTDSRRPLVYRLAPGSQTLAPHQHPLFRSLQGLAPTTDGRTVYLADYSHGLLRWTPATGTVERVRITGGGTSLGLDGLVWGGDHLYGVQNGVAPPRVVRFEFDGAGITASMTVVDRRLPEADEPTIITMLGDRLIYVANSQWEKFDEAGARRPGTVLSAPLLLSLPLAP